MNTTKEKLRKEFEEVIDITGKHEAQVTFGHHVFESTIFKWFWKHLEQREKLISDYEKVSFLKETPTIATDNTLPPSSPTATAEAIAKKIIGEIKKGSYEDWVKVISENLTEYASLKEQEAHNRAVQECIEAINTLVSKRFGLTVNNQLYYLESDEVLKELEKLK